MFMIVKPYNSAESNMKKNLKFGSEEKTEKKLLVFDLVSEKRKQTPLRYLAICGLVSLPRLRSLRKQHKLK